MQTVAAKQFCPRPALRVEHGCADVDELDSRLRANVLGNQSIRFLEFRPVTPPQDRSLIEMK